MNLQRIEAVASSVLYEDYLLYPYRPSALNSHSRFTFGGVYPHDWCVARPDGSDSPFMRVQCLVRGGAAALISVRLDFLHLVRRQVGLLGKAVTALDPEREPAVTPVDRVEVAGQLFQSWEEAEEMEVLAGPASLGELASTCAVVQVAISGGRILEGLREADGRIPAVLLRSCRPLLGQLEVGAEQLEEGLYRVCVHFSNHTPCDPAASFAMAQQRSFAASHAILGVEAGEFISLLEPPADLAHHAANCENINAWPVLVGLPGERDAVLASPILLYDYPEVAPESPVDLLEASGDDEILNLRIQAMTDAEKQAMATLDERSHALLMRTEALDMDDMPDLREPNPASATAPEPVAPLLHLHNGGMDLDVGAWVRLKPGRRADAQVMTLAGRLAVIEAIERDFEGRVRVVISLVDEPGHERGHAGDRLSFSPEEIVPVDSGSNARGHS